MKGGIGACAFRQGDLMVGAVVACNAMGDVLENGTILAGARDDSGRGFADSEAWLVAHGQRQRDVFSGKLVGENTVIGCVVTNAAMNKAQATKLAAVAQNGIARGVRPANATFDGDCLFAMCHGTVQADPDAVGDSGSPSGGRGHCPWRKGGGEPPWPDCPSGSVKRTGILNWKGRNYAESI